MLPTAIACTGQTVPIVAAVALEVRTLLCVRNACPCVMTPPPSFAEDIVTAVDMNSYAQPVSQSPKASARFDDDRAWTDTKYVYDRSLATIFRSRIVADMADGAVDMWNRNLRMSVTLRFGQPEWKGGGSWYYHRGFAVNAFRVHWYKHCGNAIVPFIVFTKNIWNNRLVRRSHQMLDAPYDGVTDIGGWLQVTETITVEWDLYQGCVRAFQAFGSRTFLSHSRLLPPTLLQRKCFDLLSSPQFFLPPPRCSGDGRGQQAAPLSCEVPR